MSLILFARRLNSRPSCIPVGRPRAREKKLGLAYERSLARSLTQLGFVHGPWFEYRTLAGTRFCQPDFVRLGAALAVVVEVKYSWVAAAHVKLREVYCPVVSRATGLSTVGLVVCKRLTGIEAEFGVQVVSSLGAAFKSVLAGRQTVLQWLGVPAQLEHTRHPDEWSRREIRCG